MQIVSALPLYFIHFFWVLFLYFCGLQRGYGINVECQANEVTSKTNPKDMEMGQK